MIDFVPDGYFPNGQSRPWKKVKVLERKGKFVKVRFFDNKQVLHVPVYSLRGNL